MQWLAVEKGKGCMVAIPACYSCPYGVLWGAGRGALGEQEGWAVGVSVCLGLLATWYLLTSGCESSMPWRYLKRVVLVLLVGVVKLRH